jgi:DNA-binding MarR family transcriptional regulator
VFKGLGDDFQAAFWAAKRLSTPTVTKAAMRMETSGLVERRPDPRDARLVRLYLTERGKALEQTIRDEMKELSRRALSSLSPAEVETLVHALAAIKKNLAS